MSGELKLNYRGRGAKTVYALIRKNDGTVWNIPTGAFVTWVDGNIGNYDIPLVDQSGYLYLANMPSGIVRSDDITVFYYEQQSSSPAIGDLDYFLYREDNIWGSTQPATSDDTYSAEVGTLGYIRQWFSQATGRFDLVTADAEGNYGADFYINQGQRFLDRFIRNHGEVRRMQKDVFVGESEVVFTGSRAIANVWIANDEARTLLERKSWKWMRKNYTGTTSTSTDHTPHVVYGTELVTNTAFDDVGEWVFGAEWLPGTGPQWSGAGDVGEPDNTLEQRIGHSVGRTYLVTLSGAKMTTGTGSLTVELGSVTGTVALTSVAGTKTVTITPTTNGNFKFSCAEEVSAHITDISVKEVLTSTRQIESIDTGTPLYWTPTYQRLSAEQDALRDQGKDSVDFALQFTYDHRDILFGEKHEYRGITIMPPPDEKYTVIVEGLFYSAVLSSASDKSWWSVNNPEVLVHAAGYLLESFYRNTEGMKDWMLSLEQDAVGLDFDIVEEESANVSRMGG